PASDAATPRPAPSPRSDTGDANRERSGPLRDESTRANSNGSITSDSSSLARSPRRRRDGQSDESSADNAQTETPQTTTLLPRTREERQTERASRSDERKRSPAPDLLAATVIEIVSEKTGYPADVLDLDMQLDADLGIDSIKRVEILSAVQDRLPSVPSISPELLGSLRTLRSILDLIAGARSAQAEKTPEADQPARTP